MAQAPNGKPIPGEDSGPYIPASTSLPEITIKALILGIVLSIVLSAANAYMGLFAGMTVSASIPAAVISMAILRLFRRHNILENNIVQTSASAGESLAAGVIFTLPALVLMGYWSGFNYVETTIIAGLGGILGVLFTIPLRRVLIVNEKLTFPEGIATAEVLKTGEEGGRGILFLALGGAIGAVFKLFQAGFHIWAETVEWARQAGRSVLYAGTNLSPALMGVGYIVGLNIAVLVFLGGAFSWCVALPVYALFNGLPEGDVVDAAWQLWSTRIRYIGVGAMVVGGLWALISLARPIVRGIGQGLRAIAASREEGGEGTLRTERDTSMKLVILGIGVLIVPIFAVYLTVVKQVAIAGFMAVVMLVAGFLFSAVAGYMAGLVGSSNNPISGVTIATILTSSLLLSVLMAQPGGWENMSDMLGPAAAIIIGAVVCCAAAIAGDNLQDLKAGHILGATPWKQQLMQVVGTLSAAVIIALVCDLILKAYGMGVPTPEHPEPLTAPQATLMQSVAVGVFQGDLPWNMISIGAVVGIAIIALDLLQKARGASFRVPVLAVAVGIYLPFELSVPIFVGGLISHFTRRGIRRMREAAGGAWGEEKETALRHGLLLSAGLITGEAIVGILMAIPIVIAQDRNVFALLDDPPGWPGLVPLIGVAVLMYLTVSRGFRNMVRKRESGS